MEEHTSPIQSSSKKAKDNLRLDLVSAYTMKARLYLNKAQEEMAHKRLKSIADQENMFGLMLGAD